MWQTVSRLSVVVASRTLFRLAAVAVLLLPLVVGSLAAPVVPVQAAGESWTYVGEEDVSPFAGSKQHDCQATWCDLIWSAPAGVNVYTRWELLFLLENVAANDIVELCITGDFPYNLEGPDFGVTRQPMYFFDAEIDWGTIAIEPIGVWYCWSNEWSGIVGSEFDSMIVSFPVNSEGAHMCNLTLDCTGISHDYDWRICWRSVNEVLLTSPCGDETEPTSTPFPVFTNVAGCFNTFTPGATSATLTSTPFGAASLTPNGSATPTTTPFSTSILPPFGVGVLSAFDTGFGFWSPFGSAIAWDGTMGHNSLGSVVFDISTESAEDSILPRLEWNYATSIDMQLTGYFYADNGAATEDSNISFSLISYIDGEWLFVGGQDNSVVVFLPQEAGQWHFFRLRSGVVAERAALVVGGAAGFSGQAFYVDELQWRLLGDNAGGGAGDCGVNTPQPLATINFEPPCDDNLCIGITPVAGDNPCLGYEGFEFEIPGGTPLAVQGVQVCFERYTIDALRLGPYDLDWLIIVTLAGIPIMLGMWLLMRARGG